MSKKVFRWLIADTVFAVAVTLLILFLGNAASDAIDNETAKTGIFVAKIVLCVIVDLVILFWFLLYWWSDRTWTKVKKKCKWRRS